MAIYHYSVHSLAEPTQLFCLQMKFQQKRVLIVPLLERERGAGWARRGKKTFTKVHNLYILHTLLTHKKKKGGVPFTLLIGCMKFLFLNLAATIFDLD